MTVGLDTSVVVRLLVGEPALLARRALAAVEEALAAGRTLVVCDLVVAESFFALQHHYGLTRARALATLHELFRTGPLRASGAAAAILATPGLATTRPGFVDRLIRAAYADTDEMWTLDHAAAKLPGVRVIDS
jgi:predicted nucleic acid-binding protein